jgi:site-specific recombinase XerD
MANERLPAPRIQPKLPPILTGQDTPAIRERVAGFYVSVAEIFERWLERRPSYHTKRSYRTDVLGFIAFVGIRWPDESWQLLQATVQDVLSWRDCMIELGRAPKTLNRRISSLSSFYKYLAAAAAELRLPICQVSP